MTWRGKLTVPVQKMTFKGLLHFVARPRRLAREQERAITLSRQPRHILPESQRLQAMGRSLTASLGIHDTGK